MLFLPHPNLFDTVYRTDKRNGVDREHTRRVIFGLTLCRHPRSAPYIRIDHRAGPGSFADNYEGEACLDCGRILREYP